MSNSMKAKDPIRQAMLDAAADALCKTDNERGLLQEVYNLGLRDGQIMQLMGLLANTDAMLAERAK